MPMPAIKPVTTPVTTMELHLPAMEAVQPSIVTIDGTTAAWAESPARILHERLVQSFATPRPDETLLPARVRLAILLGSVTVLWSVIGGVALLLR